MSRRAIKAINWAAVTERIPESEKNMLATFKTKSDQFLRRMAMNPETPPKLDWAYYKKNIATAGLVDKFQKEYEAFSVPYPADKYTSEIEVAEKESDVKVEQFLQDMDKQIANSQLEITKINSLLPFALMTMEDLRDLHPEKAFNPDDPKVWPTVKEMQLEELAKEPDEEH